MLGVVETYVSRWKMKFNSRKSKVLILGKMEAGVSWKIGEEVVKEMKSSSTLECG